MTILGQDWSYFGGIEHRDGRHDACFCRIEYSDGRQSTSAIGESILTADRMLDATESSTLTRDKVLYHQKDGGSVMATGFPNSGLL